MTANQINYAKLIEERRHNVVSEGQTGMANIIAERNAETNRMNAITNQYSANVRAGELAEMQRSNRANELLVAQRQAETARHQQESDRIEHERVYTQKYLGEMSNTTQRYLGELNSGTMQRNTDVQTRAGIVNSLTGSLASILRLVK